MWAAARSDRGRRADTSQDESPDSEPGDGDRLRLPAAGLSAPAAAGAGAFGARKPLPTPAEAWNCVHRMSEIWRCEDAKGRAMEVSRGAELAGMGRRDARIRVGACDDEMGGGSECLEGGKEGGREKGTGRKWSGVKLKRREVRTGRSQ